MANLELNAVAKGETECGKEINVGDKLTYVAHLPGAAVKVKFADGTEAVAHPACFKELR